jgi:hypothetical protein
MVLFSIQSRYPVKMRDGSVQQADQRSARESTRGGEKNTAGFGAERRLHQTEYRRGKHYSRGKPEHDVVKTVRDAAEDKASQHAHDG